MPEISWSDVGSSPVRELFKGIRLRPLWKGDNGASAQVLEIDPGCRWEGLDVHEPGPEEVYVISGVFNDGVRDYPAGTFIHNPAGSSHVPQSSTGCTSLFSTRMDEGRLSAQFSVCTRTVTDIHRLGYDCLATPDPGSAS